VTNWTEQQLADYQARRGVQGSRSTADVSAPPFHLPARTTGAVAQRTPPKREMNATESAYASHLEALKRAGQVLWWRFEPMRLRLANGAWFKPDFGVKLRDGSLEFHETKGFWREAARVRIKVAAELFPFRFIAVTRKKGGGWAREEFS
jgi:hypothetical protein